MSKRKNKKKFSNNIKRSIQNHVKIGICLQNCDECKQDSIAHEIKHHFELNYIENGMLMRFDKETKKVLVSKKQFMHLLRLCNVVECLHEYDFEFIDEIKL